MRKNKTLKILTLIVIVFSFLTLFNFNESLAVQHELDGGAGSSSNPSTTPVIPEGYEGRTSTIDSVMGKARDWLDVSNEEDTIKEDALSYNINLIYNIFLVIGMIVAVITGIMLGIKFMASSSEGKAEVKQVLIPYVIGCVVLFGAFGIWKIVMTVMGSF